MTLRLYYHPLSSFCQKALIALYETDTPFEGEILNLMDEAASATLRRLWPIAKFPVLRDEAAGRALPETSIIIEYLVQRARAATKLIPDDPERALETRLWDRVFDLYVNVPMQTVIADRMRPAGSRDPFGVAAAREQLGTAYGVIDRQLDGKTWAVGDAFTMADCAAAPALFYAGRIAPFDAHRHLADYWERLRNRPTVARVFEEAKPYLHLVPEEPSAD